MDIDYLLFLQNFRNSINDALTPFMENVSLFAITYIILLPVFVYWCLNKRAGIFTLFALNISWTINALVKLTCCVYRPWIRDARILPAGDAIKTAGGYSFPSGHTMMAGPLYGGLAVYTRKIKWLCALFVIAILVTMFSRNYLGVHTPQDVVVGLILSVLALYISDRLLSFMEHNPEKENILLFVLFVIGVASLVYVNVKNYPMDYVDGKLLVDPKKMTRDAWGDIGGFLAFIPAYYIEKRFVKFSATGFNFKGVILCVIGLIPLALMIYGLNKITVGMFGEYWGRLANRTVMMFYIVLIWPAVLKIFYVKKQ